jgi:hypothetical protein
MEDAEGAGAGGLKPRPEGPTRWRTLSWHPALRPPGRAKPSLHLLFDDVPDGVDSRTGTHSSMIPSGPDIRVR